MPKWASVLIDEKQYNPKTMRVCDRKANKWLVWVPVCEFAKTEQKEEYENRYQPDSIINRMTEGNDKEYQSRYNEQVANKAKYQQMLATRSADGASREELDSISAKIQASQSVIDRVEDWKKTKAAIEAALRGELGTEAPTVQAVIETQRTDEIKKEDIEQAIKDALTGKPEAKKS